LADVQASVLDVACGSGRHVRWFMQRGHHVTGVDRDIAGAHRALPQADLLQADIENAPWPLADAATGAVREFGVVVVTNYLWRALFPVLISSVARGGVLIYETFSAGQETIGRPRRAEFLLQPGELLQVCSDFRIVAYEEGVLTGPERYVQRIAAIRKGAVKPADHSPQRHLLS
jgi:SAM-dependent methyltransferase